MLFATHFRSLKARRFLPMTTPATRRARDRRNAAGRRHVERLEDRTLLSGWAIGFGSASTEENGDAIAVDTLGNSYVTGWFAGTVDFDPGAGVNNLTSVGTADVFIAKYTSDGAFQWARRGGGLNTTRDWGASIAVDGNGYVYVSGGFSETADFGPTTLVSHGGQDMFIAKLDSAGNFIWAESAGSTSTDMAHGIALDSAGNAYATGWFQGTADFDPGPGTFSMSAANGLGYVLKLDPSGNFAWAR